jgi:methylglutamate dehydrogenase subunit D
VFERQSALIGALQRPGRDGPGGRRQLRLGEVRDWALLELAALPTGENELAGALRSHLGIDPPTRVGVAVMRRGLQWFKTGAARFWIVAGTEEGALQDLAAAMAPTLCASTWLSHGRTCIFIEGEAARDLLARGVGIDLHPDVFEIDHYALTALQGAPVMIHRCDAGRFHLYVMRSFALAIWEWLIDAAWPFGYDIGS